MPRSRFSFPSGLGLEDGPRWAWDGSRVEHQITEGWRALMDERARQAQEDITRAQEEAMQLLLEAQQSYFRTLGANPPPHPPEPEPPTFLRKRTLRGKNGNK